MSSTPGCMTLAPKLQIPSSARRSGTSVTPFLTCHVVWHPLYFAPRLPLRSPPHPPTPPQAGLAGLMPPLRQSPATLLPNQLSPLPPVRKPMPSMVAPASSIKLLLPMPPPVGAKAKERNLPPRPLPPKSRPSSRLPHPRVLLPSPVPQGDSTPPGTYLPPIPNGILSTSAGPTWQPPS